MIFQQRGWSAIAFCAVLLSSSASFGSASIAVTVDTAVYDPARNVLTITGQNFGSAAPNVALAGTPLSIASYDASTQTIVASLSMSMGAGSYLLTVSTQNGASPNMVSEFDITIGATGLAGPQGPQGAPGPQGLPGVAGPQGAAGAPGATGPQGPAGPQGATGNTGAIGPQGPAGVVGAQGPVGANGAQGPAGANGNSVGKSATAVGVMECANGGQAYAIFSGATELAGTRTVVCDGAPGAVGATGPVGAIGPQGPQGAAGPQGLPGGIGATGAQGPQGPMGDTGAVGPQGAQGNAGATGPQGPQGVPGPAGPAGNGSTAHVASFGAGAPPVALTSSYTTVLEKTLPAGSSYVLFAKVGVQLPLSCGASCYMTYGNTPTVPLDTAEWGSTLTIPSTAQGGQDGMITLMGSLPGMSWSTIVSVNCLVPNCTGTSYATTGNLTALSVGALQ
jgi:hypothetical protein